MRKIRGRVKNEERLVDKPVDWDKLFNRVVTVDNPKEKKKKIVALKYDLSDQLGISYHTLVTRIYNGYSPRREEWETIKKFFDLDNIEDIPIINNN